MVKLTKSVSKFTPKLFYENDPWTNLKSLLKTLDFILRENNRILISDVMSLNFLKKTFHANLFRLH